MAKEKEKDKLKLKAPKPTYTPINASLNADYVPPKPKLKSNLVVSQQDIMPVQQAQTQASQQPIQVRGALAALQPTPEPKTDYRSQFPQFFDPMQQVENIQNRFPGAANPPTQTNQPYGTPAEPLLWDRLASSANAPAATPAQQVPGTLFNSDLSPATGVSGIQGDSASYIAEQARKRDAQDPDNPILKWLKDNTVDAAAGLADRALVNNEYGRLLNTATYGMGAVQGVNLTEAGAPPRLSSGSKIADTGALLLGNLGGAIANPAALDQSLLTGGYNIANKLVQGNKAGRWLSNTGQSALNNATSKIGIKSTGNLVERGLTGAAAGGIQGGALSLIAGQSDLDQVAKNAALGAAFGGAGDAALYGLGRAISAIFKRNNVPEEVVGEMLALPAPRERGVGNVNGAVTPDVMTGYTGPVGALPAPAMSGATTGRIAQSVNPFRQQFEQLMQTAKQMQQEGRFTPGKEAEELESLWTQMAGREGVSLDELIQRAYQTKPSKLSSDLVQRAKSTQAAREVAGAPLPVKSTGDRLTSKQGVLGSPAPLTQRFIRAGGSADDGVRAARSSQSVQRPRIDVTDVSQQGTVIPGDVAPPSRISGSSRERGFVSTLRASNNASPKLKEGLANSANRNYKRITNSETLRQANARIDRKGIDEAEAALLNKSKFKAEDVATGMRIIQQLQDAGETTRAVSVAEKLSKQLTEAGQAVQAASIWNRLSPEGALLAAQRKVNAVNERLLRGQKEMKISEQQAQNIKDAAESIQAAGVSKERAGTVSEIADRLKKGEDITADERKLLTDFIDDLKTFVKPSRGATKSPKIPAELKDARVRDRIVSFMDGQADEALARIKARKNTLSSTPFDVWGDYAIVGAAKIVKGAKSFADWSEQMIKDFGDDIKPHLPNLFERSQQHVTQNAKKINAQVVSRAENIAESYIKNNEAKLSDPDIEFIRNMARAVSEQSGDAQRIASQDLQAIISGFEKVGIGRKLASAQYISMLLNPLTQIRNIVGNEMLYRAERMARIIGTPIDIAASKISGGPRTMTFKSGPSVWDDFFTTTTDFWSKLGEGGKAGWRGVSPEGLTSKYEIQGKAFRSKYNPLTYMEKALGAALQGFDYAAYTRASNQRMREMAYLDALNKGIQGDDAIKSYMQTYMTNIDEGIHNIAKQYGKFATLQDDTMLATKLMGFRRGLNNVSTFGGSKEFGAGSLIVPFAKTPANLLLRGLDYSPVGILKALKQTHDLIRGSNGDLTRADVIDSVSRALMGTGLTAGAYWLADKGALFGKSNKDPEVRKLNQSTGIKDFQINGSALVRMIEALGSGEDVDAAAKLQSGDTLWAYQWAQPMSMPMAVGSNVYQSIKDKQGPLQTAGDAALAGASTILDSSLLSGIREAFQIPSGEDNAFKAVAMNLIKQAPSQFVPSLVRQFNTVFDDKVRETYSPDTIGKITNTAETSIPGLAQKMPQRVDTLGNPQTKLNTIFDVFISPAARSKYIPTPEAQLVIDLLNETGDKNLAPRAVSRYISGTDTLTGEKRKVDLTPEQFVELQTIVGQATSERIKKINPNLPTDQKIALVLKAYDEAGVIGRNKIKKDVGLKVKK